MAANNIRSILFVCHGNICRSPMAEFVLKYLIAQSGNEVVRNLRVESAATSDEEHGNHIYPQAARKLTEKGIPFDRSKTARQMTRNDCETFDMIIAMEHYNLRNMHWIVGDNARGKVSLLMDYTNRPGDVSDPWYTRDFEKAFSDIMAGCKGLLTFLENNCQFPTSRNRIIHN